MDKNILMDVLTTGLEGGIDYWACLDNTTKDWKEAKQKIKEKNDDYVIEDIMLELLQSGKGVKFEDVEEEEDSEDWILTMENLLNGIELWCDWKNIRSFERWYNDKGQYQFDANDADCIYQFALFGDIIFG